MRFWQRAQTDGGFQYDCQKLPSGLTVCLRGSNSLSQLACVLESLSPCRCLAHPKAAGKEQNRIKRLVHQSWIRRDAAVVPTVAWHPLPPKPLLDVRKYVSSADTSQDIWGRGGGQGLAVGTSPARADGVCPVAQISHGCIAALDSSAPRAWCLHPIPAGLCPRSSGGRHCGLEVASYL